MAKKLPNGFQSWIEFYGYLKTHKPELLRSKTIRYMQYQPYGQQPMEAYSVQVDTIKRNCWREMLELNFNESDLYLMKISAYNSNDENFRKKVSIFCNKFQTTFV